MRHLINFLCLALFSISSIQASHAIDLQPGDVVAPPPGIHIFQSSYQYAEKNDFYVKGNKKTGVPSLSSSTYFLRYGHAFQLQEKPAFFYTQTNFGALNPEGVSSDSGFGDTSFVLAVWPYANRVTQTYLGVAAYLTVPTGRYDTDQAYNLGENRYKTALQVGYQQPLIQNVSFMTALDAIFYGDNKNANTPRSHQKLEQEMLYTAQFGLTYDFDSRYTLAGTYFYSYGGETSFDGISQDNVINLQRYQLSGVMKFPSSFVTVQYGGDIKTENGYYEDQRLILRYTMRF